MYVLEMNFMCTKTIRTMGGPGTSEWGGGFRTYTTLGWARLKVKYASRATPELRVLWVRTSCIVVL